MNAFMDDFDYFLRAILTIFCELTFFLYEMTLTIECFVESKAFQLIIFPFLSFSLQPLSLRYNVASFSFIANTMDTALLNSPNACFLHSREHATLVNRRPFLFTYLV